MTPHLGLRRNIVAVTLLPALLGCDSTGTVCDARFLAVPITVVDTLGTPVSQAGVTSILARTGDTLFASPIGISVRGSYVILTDLALPRIRHAGDPIDVTVNVPPDQRTVRYVFDSPEGCHIHKVSGPDTLAVP